MPSLPKSRVHPTAECVAWSCRASVGQTVEVLVLWGESSVVLGSRAEKLTANVIVVLR